MADSATTTTTPIRRAYPGSCHCGLTRYIVHLILPSPFSASNPPRHQGDQELYRCNCTTCHKMNFFHVRPAHPVDDFMLLAPLNPDAELTTYRCAEGKLKYWFCPVCGVRCLTFGGEGELLVVDEADANSKDQNAAIGGQTEVWRAKWDGDKATEPYVSVNGTTIDFSNEFDMRLLTEQKKVQYLDGRSHPDEERDISWDRPHYGGCF